MIQFNLLPDIKVQYLKAKRQKRLVVVSSVLASAVALAVFVLLLSTVFILQKKNLSDLNKDIKSNSSQLQGVKDLNKILTVQNQLGALTSLHDNKVVSSRLLDYLTQVTPSDASISKLDVDFAAHTMIISGTANAASIVNTYADTLKFTKYQVKSGSTEQNAFSNVVLNSFTRDSKTATYEIDLSYDPVIFSNADNVTLKVPNIISTRSEVDKPTDLFQQSTTGQQ
jgi:Tfp pilus assembly protein PilN